MATSKIIFDADCLSSFLWVDKLDILYSLFKDTIYIPLAVYDEIMKLKRGRKSKHIPLILEKALNSNKIKILTIHKGSAVNDILKRIKKEYLEEHNKDIGSGEAEMLALAIHFNAICITKSASNNLKDVYNIATKENIVNITTMDILSMAYKQNLNPLNELENIRIQMIAKRKWLGSLNVKDYMAQKNK